MKNEERNEIEMEFCVQLVDNDPELKTTSNETFKCNTIERFLSINNKRNYKRDLSISANHKYYTNVTQTKNINQSEYDMIRLFSRFHTANHKHTQTTTTRKEEDNSQDVSVRNLISMISS